ncbi:hypothetical protein [Salmonella sp. NW582]|uniref:hypothetical protein n=1 Tax=Salmonella sp. NW582 TaxID=2948111 RepID=UPI003F43BB5B
MNFLKEIISENNHRKHNPYGNSYVEEHRIIEKPVVYECVEEQEFIRPAHHHNHHHHEHYEPERRVEYVEYDRGCEYERDGGLSARYGRGY